MQTSNHLPELPNELYEHICHFVDSSDLISTSYYINSQWRLFAIHELNNRYGKRLEGIYSSSLLKIKASRHSRKTILLYRLILDMDESKPRKKYKCASCLESVERLGECFFCTSKLQNASKQSFPWIRTFRPCVVSIMGMTLFVVFVKRIG